MRRVAPQLWKMPIFVIAEVLVMAGTWCATVTFIRKCIGKCSRVKDRRRPSPQEGTMIFDHIDLRVADVTKVRPFYDTFLKAFGFRGQRQADGNIVYYRIAERRVREAVAIIESATHVASETRLAFHAAKPEDVDRIAGIALAAGACAFEAPQWCPEIAGRYYATFFEDPSGNRLEVVCR
jgi:predicted lactoylglutathione lyase